MHIDRIALLVPALDMTTDGKTLRYWNPDHMTPLSGSGIFSRMAVSCQMIPKFSDFRPDEACMYLSGSK